MRTLATNTTLVLLMLFITAPAVQADSMRCGQSIVTREDSKLEVLRLCGEPDYRDVVSGEEQDKVEVWIYDFGTHRFQYVVTFKGIRIFDIEAGPSPRPPRESGRQTLRCGRKVVHLGMNKLEVIKRCGEPQLSEVVSGADFGKREIWSYEFGSTRFVYHLTFHGVRLAEIDSEPR